jgi:hypothetical protein
MEGETMPSDRSNKHEVMPKRRVVDLIERTQEDAMRKLRQSGVPDVQVLRVMQRITSLCLQTLRELDLTYQQFEEIVAEDGRSEANQTWLNNKATAMLLQVESAIATLVAETIAQAIHDHKTQPPPAEPVIEVQRAQPAPPVRQHGLLAAIKLLLWLCLWLCAFPASLLLGYQLTGSEWWQLLFPLGLLVVWILFRFSWWGLIFPVTILSTEALLYLLPPA